MHDVTAASKNDFIQPFLLETSGLRGRLVRMGPVVNDVIERHKLPKPVQQLMAEFVVLAATLSAALKFDGVFSLHAKGNGPVGLIAADITSAGGVRAYASLNKSIPEDVKIERSLVPQLLGTGHLAFTVNQGEHSETYQGIVDLQGSTLIDCMHHYFQQSDQFFAALTLGAQQNNIGKWSAGAMMLQRLPQDEQQIQEEEINENWRRATVLLSSYKQRELLAESLPARRLLFNLFHEDGIRVFDTLPLQFSCRCSRERARGILSMLSEEEIEEYKIDGYIAITCEFCNTKECFNDASIRASKYL